MDTNSTKFHSGPDRPDGTTYVGSMSHERNKAIHTNNAWLETGLDKDRHVLFSGYITEDLAASRLFNWTWSDNYRVLSSNVNEIVLKRSDPTRTCQTLVFRRVQFITRNS